MAEIARVWDALPDADACTLVRRFLDGCDRAATDLVARFARPLRAFIRRRLPPRMRAILEPTDLEQRVWASFFRRGPHLEALGDGDRLLKLLCAIARNKTRQTLRDQARDKRNRAREVPFTVAFLAEPPLLSPQPGPAEIVERNETWADVLQGLPEQSRVALDLLRQRYSLADVAVRLGVSVRTVSRIVAGVRERYRSRRPSAAPYRPGPAG